MIKSPFPQVSAVAIINGQVFVLGLSRDQLARRGPGDLVTAEVLTVIPTEESHG